MSVGFHEDLLGKEISVDNRLLLTNVELTNIAFVDEYLHHMILVSMFNTRNIIIFTN